MVDVVSLPLSFMTHEGTSEMVSRRELLRLRSLDFLSVAPLATLGKCSRVVFGRGSRIVL